MVQPLVLKERPRKLTPSEMIEAIAEQKDALAAMESFLTPLADMGTFRALLDEVQEGRKGHMATLEGIHGQMGSISQNISQALSSQGEGAMAAKAVVESLPVMMETMQAQLASVMAMQTASNEAVAKSLKSLAAAVGKMAKTSPDPVKLRIRRDPTNLISEIEEVR